LQTFSISQRSITSFGPVSLAAGPLTILFFLIFLAKPTVVLGPSSLLAQLGPPHPPSLPAQKPHTGPAGLPACAGPAHPGHLLHLAKPRRRVAPLSGAAAPCTTVGQPSPRASRRIEVPPGRLPSPLINLVPRRLLSLLHSPKWPVLNFRRHQSVASSVP
jgi:hypothetical protein